MGLLGFKGMRRFVLFMLVLMAGLGDGKVVLIGKDVTLSFDDVEANFCKKYELYVIILCFL